MGGDAGPGLPPVRPGALILPGRREERNRRKSLRRDGEETERGGKEADLQHQEKKTERDGQKEDWKDNSSSRLHITEQKGERGDASITNVLQAAGSRRRVYDVFQ